MRWRLPSAHKMQSGLRPRRGALRAVRAHTTRRTRPSRACPTSQSQGSSSYPDLTRKRLIAYHSIALVVHSPSYAAATAMHEGDNSLFIQPSTALSVRVGPDDPVDTRAQCVGLRVRRLTARLSRIE